MSIYRDYVHEIDGPVWPDMCGHGQDCYVGSIEVYPAKGLDDKYDVYVYNEETYTVYINTWQGRPDRCI